MYCVSVVLPVLCGVFISVVWLHTCKIISCVLISSRQNGDVLGVVVHIGSVQMNLVQGRRDGLYGPYAYSSSG